MGPNLEPPSCHGWHGTAAASAALAEQTLSRHIGSFLEHPDRDGTAAATSAAVSA